VGGEEDADGHEEKGGEGKGLDHFNSRICAGGALACVSLGRFARAKQSVSAHGSFAPQRLNGV